MGLEIGAEWKLVDGGSTEGSPGASGEGGRAGGLVLRETTTVSCNVLLMPYVRATMGKSHAELHQTFVKRLLEEQRRGRDSSD